MEKAQRLISLDILRGITIAGMIIVNNPGSWKHVYAPLTHAEWNGLTPTDLVFPFFMFIMGISTYISLKKFHFSYSTSLVKKVIKRTVWLFLIGLFLNWCAKGLCSFQELRIPGVLQRLALCYFFTVIICTNIREKNIPILIAVLLIAYQVILMMGNGFVQGPQNIIVLVDQQVMGISHLYNDNGLDPEGILSTMPSIAHTLIGYYIGKICIEKENIHNKLEKLLLTGTVLLFAGYLFSYGCPINKKIWSPTFVLVTCGAGILLLSLLIWLIDIRNYQKGFKLFNIYGINPLFCYTAGELLFIALIHISVGGKTLHTWYYQHILASWFGDNCFSSLLMALSLAAVIGIVGYILYRKHIYIKI